MLKDIICAVPLGQRTPLGVISGPLSSLLLRKKIQWVPKKWAEKWGTPKKNGCHCPWNKDVVTGVEGRDEATDKQITPFGSGSTFCAEGAQRRSERADAGVTHPLLEGSHLGGEMQRPF